MIKGKILVVEDEADLRELIFEKLTEIGFQVYAACDGEEGLKKAQEIRPDIIISDVVMPEKDGNQFYKELRLTDFGKKIPFIILTARGKMKDYFEMMEVNGFIEKPFKMVELMAEIERVLSGSADCETKKETADGSADGSPLRPRIRISSQAEGVLSSDMMHVSGGGRTAAPDAEKVKRTWKILLGEDDPRIHNKLQQIFFKINCFTRITLTPSKCIEEAVSYLPDLILIKDIFCGMRSDQLIDLFKGMSRLRGIPIAVYGGNELKKMKKDIAEKDVSVVLCDGESQLFQNLENFVKELFK